MGRVQMKLSVPGPSCIVSYMSETMECRECGVTSPLAVCWVDEDGRVECPECGERNAK